MDETACWMDMPSETTVTHIGVCSVPLKTTGHEKFILQLYSQPRPMVLTMVLIKLKPFVVFKSKGT